MAKLLSSASILGDNIYPLIGVIERWNPKLLSTQYIDFPLALVISGDYDRKLQDQDAIHLFSNAQISQLQGALSPSQSDHYTANYASANSRAASTRQNQSRGLPPEAQGSLAETNKADDSLSHDPELLSFLRERMAFIRGAVRHPGPYPVSEGLNLNSLIGVAGGLSLEANISNIEVASVNHGTQGQANKRSGINRLQINLHDTKADTVLISPGDSVRISQKFQKVADKSVLLIGEVQNPGRYDLLAGDTLFDLIKRAGGMTDQAYPDGAIFSRESERRIEESRFRRAALDLERSLAAAIENTKSAPNTTQISMVKNLSNELKNAQALGRITVEADPAALKSNPALNMLLESGDRLYIPKRPLTVRVTGEVLSPASLQFRDSKKPRDYLNEAGGFTFHADKDRVFVLYPDGSAQPLQVRAWNYKPIFVPPGSTIVVPRDPKPFDFVQSAKDISQIFSNLAITSVFIDDIRDDD